MADELEVVVSADASRLNTEMAKATNSLQKFKAGSAQAQQSLMNLGRVVQDAPYGFIGIANNIDPLLESFQRLKAETGTTGSALKALGSSLLGAGGLGVAVSAITSLLVVFGGNLLSTAEKTEPVAKGIDEIAEAAKRAQTEIKLLGDSFAFAAEQGNLIAKLNFGNSFEGNLIIAKQRSVGLSQQIVDLEEKLQKLQDKRLDGIKNQTLNTEELSVISAQYNEIEKELNKLYQDRKLAQLQIKVLVADQLRDTKKVKEEVESLDKIVKKVQPILYEVKLKEPFSIPALNLGKPPSKQIEAFVRDFADEINAFLQKSAVDIGISFGETLGQALAGGASIGDFFKGIFAVVGAGLKQLGATLLAASITIKGIKEFLLKNPVLAIAGSIALIALGSLIQAATSRQAFATGTRFAPGGTALVGERGPELVSLPEGARVTPAAQTGAILGGAMQSIQVYGVMRGRDIYFTNQRYGNSFNVGT